MALREIRDEDPPEAEIPGVSPEQVPWNRVR